MYYDLSKPEKKIARILIDKGLDIAYTKALQMAEDVIEQWKSEKLPTKDAYLKLYRQLEKHDDGIGERFNNLGGSKYLMCVAHLFGEDVLTEEDVAPFSEHTRNIINVLSGKTPLE